MAAWEFQALQNVAEKHGWHKFISMQNYYNLLYREEEREMLPYCRDTGIGCIPVRFSISSSPASAMVWAAFLTVNSGLLMRVA